MVRNHILLISFTLALGLMVSGCQSSSTGLKQSFTASLPVMGEIVFSD
jgi:uncharacterized lipoprotein YajG